MNIGLRGHKGPILSCKISSERRIGFTGGQDGNIMVWNLPPPGTEIYSPVDRITAYRADIFTPCADSVWDLSLHSYLNLLVSANSDGTIKYWNFHKPTPLQASHNFTPGGVSPSTIELLSTNEEQLLIGYTSGAAALLDNETGKIITTLHGNLNDHHSPDTQINKIISHPTQSIAITAHENNIIKFFDIKSSQCINTINAHEDAVTSLAMHSYGEVLVSGSHDGSIRIWDYNLKTCQQEISKAHRRKNDEAIHAVCFHPTNRLLVSAGADSFVKLYI